MVCDLDLLIENGRVLFKSESPFDNLIVLLNLLRELFDLEFREIVTRQDCDDGSDAGPDKRQYGNND